MKNIKNAPEMIWLTPDSEDPKYIIWQSDQPADHDEYVTYVRLDAVNIYGSQQADTAHAKSPCKYCAYFIKSIGHNYCANCGRELPTV